MSWMDSWSRPTKHAATPPPLYLTPGGDAIPYCHTCGRVISTRKSQTTKAASTPVKYCSDRCRHNKPNQAPGSVDRRISDAFIALLDGRNPSPALSQDAIESAKLSLSKSAKGSQKKVKGETRITVSCDDVEAIVFGVRHDPGKAFGRKKNRAPRGAPEPKEWKSVDMEDSNSDAMKVSGQTNHSDPTDDPSLPSESESDTNPISHADMINLRIRPPQSQSDVNGSIGGEKGWAEKIVETPEMLQKRLDGQKRAEQRELVRCAARRLCAFGVLVDGMREGEGEGGKGAKGKMKMKGKGKDRGKDGLGGDDGSDDKRQENWKKCEAVIKGNVVEASYAKGEWGIRWRE